MEKESISKIGNEKLPSIVKDPFKKNCVTRISITYEEGLFDNTKWSANGWVYFKNGNSKGQQDFKGENFDSVVLQVKAFLNTLT